MIGTLLFLTALGVSGLSCLSDNHYCKKTSIHKEGDDTVWYDRKGREIRNGERTTYRVREDKYGNLGGQVVGVNSGRVYEDSLAKKYAFYKAEEDKEAQWAKENGNLAYNKYYPQYNKAYTTEISTGKIISCLWEYKTECDGPSKYRKFYFDPATMTIPKGTAPGDIGVEISLHEYVDLHGPLMFTGDSFPYDSAVRRKLGDWLYS